MVLLVSKLRIKKTLTGTLHKVNRVHFYRHHINEFQAVKVLKYSNDITAKRQYSFCSQMLKVCIKIFTSQPQCDLAHPALKVQHARASEVSIC